jgi:3-keto-disaccharide hydrolase
MREKEARMKNALAAVAILCMVEGSAMADEASFADDTVGATPKGWTATMTGSGKPKWTVEEDATAPSASKVVKQSGRATYPLLLRDGTSLKDGFVEIRFKALSGSEDRAGGIVWRAKDANNYYVVRANALENNVVLYKTVGGKRSSLDIVGQKGGYGVKLPVPAGQWHKLRVEFSGSRFKVVFNGQLAFEVEDRTFSDAGQIGLWTKADSVTAFDSVTYGMEP